MNKNLLVRRLTLLFIILIIVSIALIQKTSRKISTKGQIIPASRVKIILDLPNSINLETSHFLTNQDNSRKSFHFDRGDNIDFEVYTNLVKSKSVESGDKIAQINSNLLEQEISQLNREITFTKTTINELSTGQKPAIIEEARNKLKLSETRLSEQKLIVDRLGELKKSNLVSAQEFEIAENYLHQLEVEVLVEKSYLQTVLTGEKNETIDVMSKQLEELERELKVLQKKQDAYTIYSSIAGTISVETDSLITITNNQEVGVIFPIKLNKLNSIKIGQKVEIISPDLKINTTGTIVNIAKNITNIAQTQTILVTAKIDNNFIPVGTVVKCNIISDPQPFYKNLLQMFKYVEIN